MAEEFLRLPLPKDLSLKVLLTGGDRFQETPQTEFPFRLVNHYGPTENTVVSTFGPIVQIPGIVGPPPIGRPISNTVAYILDESFQPVPIGVAGELHVGGVGLARGYLNRPELTAEKFIRNPFSNDPKSRLYKTGDLARYRPDGNIEFLGRMDHQVKIRGFRIELGEIESVLKDQGCIRKALVVAREDTPGGKRLVAYVVPEDGRNPTGSELRSFLREKLPEYMVPSACVFLDEFPLTPNGKIDRKALPEPDTGRPLGEEAYVAPQTDAEKALAAIWSEILRLEDVGTQDNFFNLGGHSLMAIRMISRIRSEFHVNLTLPAIFKHQTLEALAGQIETLRWASGIGHVDSDSPGGGQFEVGDL